MESSKCFMPCFGFIHWYLCVLWVFDPPWHDYLCIWPINTSTCKTFMVRENILFCHLWLWYCGFLTVLNLYFIVLWTMTCSMIVGFHECFIWEGRECPIYGSRGSPPPAGGGVVDPIWWNPVSGVENTWLDEDWSSLCTETPGTLMRHPQVHGIVK